MDMREVRRLKSWIEFKFLQKNAYHSIGKGSVVNIGGEKYMVKRIDSIILLDEAVKEPNTVQVFARGIKLN